MANIIGSSEPQKIIALGTAWQPTFNKTTFNFDKAKTHLDNLGDIGNFCDEFAPSYWNFRDAIGKGPSTLLGPDALPYAAWKACGDVGIRSLMLIDTDLRNGGDPDADFNTSSMAVPRDPFINSSIMHETHR